MDSQWKLKYRIKVSSAKPKVVNALVFCSKKSFISLAREKVKFEVVKLFSSSDVSMVLPFTYYVPSCLQSRLGSRYKTIKLFKINGALS